MAKKEMTLGKRIKIRRQELGFSQREVANALNVSQNTITWYETDKVSTPNRELLNRMAKVLQIEPQYFFGADEATLNEYTLQEKQWMTTEEGKAAIKTLYLQYAEQNVAYGVNCKVRNSCYATECRLCKDYSRFKPLVATRN